MATEGTKIKVKNPVVELDGDEVGFLSSDLKFEFDLQLDRLSPVLYITFAGFTVTSASDVHFRHSLRERGEKRRTAPAVPGQSCQSSEDY
jgi:hypothetical protein